MAEVGLLPYARIALQVSNAVLPRYRSRFSKHQFTQPQLLAVLCLMRYEDWTFQEAEVQNRPREGSARGCGADRLNGGHRHRLAARRGTARIQNPASLRQSPRPYQAPGGWYIMRACPMSP